MRHASFLVAGDSLPHSSGGFDVLEGISAKLLGAHVVCRGLFLVFFSRVMFCFVEGGAWIWGVVLNDCFCVLRFALYVMRFYALMRCYANACLRLPD